MRTREAGRDPSDMMGAVRGLPDQLEEGWRRVSELRLPPGSATIDGVAVAGMGGSAIGGDMAFALFGREIPVPSVVVRDFRLPAWVGRRTLVIASSFSGNTEETLSAYDDATSRGAHVVVVTGGGELAARARRDDVAVVELPQDGQPRAALGVSMTGVLAVLRAAGLIEDPGGAIAEAARAMRGVVADFDRDPDGHLATRLAHACVGRVPIVYAAVDLEPVARRWKTQLNENGKATAAWDVHPELGHNAIVGYHDAGGAGRLVHVIVLQTPGDHPRVARRSEVIAGLMADLLVPHDVVRAPDGGRAAQALWLVQLGDLVSVLLAYDLGVDPTPVETIARLKGALAATA